MATETGNDDVPSIVNPGAAAATCGVSQHNEVREFPELCAVK